MSHIIWMQEMEMEFLDELNSLFPNELIISCLEDYPYSESFDIKLSGPLYVGVDLGRYRDSTVIVAVEKMSDERMRVVFVKEFSRIDMVYQREYMSRFIERFSPIRMIIDKTGMGIPICDFLAKKYANVDGLTLTQNIKEAIILNLYSCMKSGRLRIPIDCEPLIKQLHQFQRVQDSSGRVRYEAPPGAHDDHVIALALAVYAATSPPENIKIKEVRRW
ncbi:MAG: hypothetical protein ABDH32_07610 [Candidatus Caldarchaeales archaeon]